MLPTSENWIQTYSGHAFRPLGEVDSGQIDIIDIAHSLSMQCRFNGHCLRFYSVAEHCVHAANYIDDPDYAFDALMHDASEAYLCDIPKPLKPLLPGYEEAEARLEQRIAQKFFVNYPYPHSVKRIDVQMLADEAAVNMGPAQRKWDEMPEPIGIDFQYWSPNEAKERFLEKFVKLYEKRLHLVR